MRPPPYNTESSVGEGRSRYTSNHVPLVTVLPPVKLSLIDNWYYRAACGNSEKWEINASKNIRIKGLRALTSGGRIPEAWLEVKLTASGEKPLTQNGLLGYSNQ